MIPQHHLHKNFVYLCKNLLLLCFLEEGFNEVLIFNLSHLGFPYAEILPTQHINDCLQATATPTEASL